jgi:carbonic anhydrase
MKKEPLMSPTLALQRLKEGNARFVRGASAGHTVQCDWLSMAEGQQPFASILGCSDSRVPPEIVFDQGMGDLFIVRVAGNVVGVNVLGSLGYALEHLKTHLIVVLGHERCGAVQAALNARFHGIRERRTLGQLVDHIIPGLADINPGEPAEQQWNHAVEANVRWTVQQLADTTGGRAAITEGRLLLAGAIYEIGTGRVRFLDQPEPLTPCDPQTPGDLQINN